MAHLDDDPSIERLALAFLDRTLPKGQWTHEAHFAVALWLLRHRPELSAPEVMRAQISAYNEATGTANTETSGYHHTITIASLRAARGRLENHSPEARLALVLKALMASPQGDPKWLLAYWNRERLFSAEARATWLEPDLADLPF